MCTRHRFHVGGLGPGRNASALHAGREASYRKYPSSGVGYYKTLEQIRAVALDSREVRLAIVFTQGDLVNSPDRKVARWARCQLGLGDLVSSVHRDFKENRFFCADVDKIATGRACCAGCS